MWRDELEFAKKETGTPEGGNRKCQGYRIVKGDGVSRGSIGCDSEVVDKALLL